MNWDDPKPAPEENERHYQPNLQQVVISLVKKHLTSKNVNEICQQVAKKLLHDVNIQVIFGDSPAALFEDKLFLKFAVTCRVREIATVPWIVSTDSEKINNMLSKPIRDRLLFMPFDSEWQKKRTERKTQREDNRARQVGKVLSTMINEDSTCNTGEVLAKYMRAEETMHNETKAGRSYKRITTMTK